MLLKDRKNPNKPTASAHKLLIDCAQKQVNDFLKEPGINSAERQNWQHELLLPRQQLINAPTKKRANLQQCIGRVTLAPYAGIGDVV